MKKLFSMILALMLCILPAASMAELGVIGGADGPTLLAISAPSIVLPSDLQADALSAGRKGITYLTVTDVAGINTGDPTVDEALIDLVKVLGLYASAQGDETEVAVTISDIDVLNLGLAVNGDDAYIQSNLLGDTIVISLDEVEPVVSRLMDVLVLMGMLDERYVAEYKEIIAEAMSSVTGELSASMAVSGLTEEDFMSLNYFAIEEILKMADAKITPIDAPVVPRNCDFAASGVTVTLSNEDVLYVMECAVKFLKDNPVLLDYMDVSVAEMTGAAKLESVLDETLAAMKDHKILDGECVVYCCFDEAGDPVYATFTMPLYEVYNGQDYTTVIEAVYSRQTVAQGVSHVMNMNVEGETLTVDALVGENTLHVQLSVPGEEPVIFDAMVEGNDLKATLTAKPDDSTAITLTLDGTYLCTDTEYKLAGKFTMTEVFTPADSAAPSVNGLTLPGFNAYKPKAKTTYVEVGFDADYDRNDVDFNGVTDLWLVYDDVRVALQAKSWTTSATESIMAGNVVRPAELDDNAFTNWFVRVFNNFGLWAANLLNALPESFLAVLMHSGLF